MSDLKKLYEGKAKTVFEGPSPDEVLIYFKDDTTAFNGEKKEQISGKGEVNHEITRYIFRYLSENGIPTHYLKNVDERTILAKKVRIIPIEFVVRNIAAGSISKRLGIPEGKKLEPTVLEFYLKDDSLGDPIINQYHIQALSLCGDKEMLTAVEYSFRINVLLSELFRKSGMNLVDFKIEFGITTDGKVVLADEISPDSCRLWDIGTGNIMDKDIFRKGLNGMMDKYSEVLDRIREELDGKS